MYTEVTCTGVKVRESAATFQLSCFSTSHRTVTSTQNSTVIPKQACSLNADVCACSAGGVVVASGDGKIVCSNTIDERLKIAYAQNLPMIRGTFFGIEAPVREDMHL